MSNVPNEPGSIASWEDDEGGEHFGLVYAALTADDGQGNPTASGLVMVVELPPGVARETTDHRQARERDELAQAHAGPPPLSGGPTQSQMDARDLENQTLRAQLAAALGNPPPPAPPPEPAPAGPTQAEVDDLRAQLAAAQAQAVPPAQPAEAEAFGAAAAPIPPSGEVPAP